MNRLFLFFIFPFGIAYSHGQPNAEALKKENQKLKNYIEELKRDTTELNLKIKFCDALNQSKALEVKGISNAIDLQILSCTGDKNNQTVKIEFVIIHKLLHQSICIANTPATIKAYDEIGNELPMKATDIGTNSEGAFTAARCNKVPTEVPVKGYIVFKNVLPSTSLLKFVSAGFKFRNYDSKDDYEYGTLEIKNLKIKW